jgi:hypothetical protein
MYGYIYLIQTREFYNSKEQTYKIGRSKDVLIRHKQYLKGSILLFCRAVNDAIKLESIICEQFKINFIHKREYGTEYFNGNCNEMINIINNLIDKYDIVDKLKICDVNDIRYDIAYYHMATDEEKNIIWMNELNIPYTMINEYNKKCMEKIISFT